MVECSQGTTLTKTLPYEFATVWMILARIALLCSQMNVSCEFFMVAHFDQSKVTIIITVLFTKSPVGTVR